jgi:L-serine dehydratase
MKSVRNIYKIGVGPSSSHTMGPTFAAKKFLERNTDIDRVKVILYGSLSKTGKGHGTDRAIVQAVEPIPCEIVFNNDDSLAILHPNTMELIGYKSGEETAKMTVLSIGGGEIKIVGEDDEGESADVYEKNSFNYIPA